MLTTAAKTAMRGTLDAAKRAVPHLIAHKVVSTIADLSEDRSSIIESSGRVGTLRNDSAYHEPTWHFDAKFVDGQGHEMARKRLVMFIF